MFRFSIIFSLLIISCNSHAANLLWGISAISQEINQEVNNAGTISNITDDGSGFGIYADSYYQNTYRFNGTLSYVDYTNFAITSATASADYLIPANNQATLFVGATAGAISQTYSSSGVSDSAFSGIAGIQLGAIVLLSDNIMIEAGYRLRYTQLETEFTGTSTTSTIDEINETYLSLILLL